MSDTQTYHDAALDDLRSMTREAKAVVEEIKLAAREMTDQRTPYHAEQQTSVSLGTITCTVRSAVPVEGVSRWVNAPGMLPGRAVWLQARHNLPWLLAMHADNAPQSPTENNTAPQSLAVDNSFSGSDLTPTSEGRIFICEDQYNFGPKIFRMRVGDIFDYGTQDPSRNPADLSQPQPTRNN
jgi:hypothetical protein